MTNTDFKEFVDAGGYAERASTGKGSTFVTDGVRAAVRTGDGAVVDSTGRPGPASWELGDYPEGQGDYPVTGVSRYEAAAYARFRGKQLPTVYHWTKAGRTDMGCGSSLVGVERAAQQLRHHGTGRGRQPSRHRAVRDL